MSRHRNDQWYQVTFSMLGDKTGWQTMVSGDLETVRAEITDFINHHLHTSPGQRETRIYLDAMAGCAVIPAHESFGVPQEEAAVAIFRLKKADKAKAAQTEGEGNDAHELA